MNMTILFLYMPPSANLPPELKMALLGILAIGIAAFIASGKNEDETIRVQFH